MGKFSLKEEINESWAEFSGIVLKFTPVFLKKLYSNKPLFLIAVVLVFFAEITFAYFIYDYFFTD